MSGTQKDNQGSDYSVELAGSREGFKTTERNQAKHFKELIWKKCHLYHLPIIHVSFSPTIGSHLSLFCFIFKALVVQLY